MYKTAANNSIKINTHFVEANRKLGQQAKQYRIPHLPTKTRESLQNHY